MKKLLGLGFALFCIATVATSCGDDDSTPAVNLDNLTKKWYYVSYKVAGQTVNYDGNLACGKDYLQFISPGTLKDVDIYDCQAEADVTDGTYTASGSSLTTVLEGESTSYNIKTLNANSLEIEEATGNPKITYVFTSTP